MNWYGKNELIPVHLENNIFNFYLSRKVKSTETNNVNSAQPIGDDIEPVGDSGVDVEMVNEEDEELLEAPRSQNEPEEANEQRETRT